MTKFSHERFTHVRKRENLWDQNHWIKRVRVVSYPVKKSWYYYIDCGLRKVWCYLQTYVKLHVLCVILHITYKLIKITSKRVNIQTVNCQPSKINIYFTVQGLFIKISFKCNNILAISHKVENNFASLVRKIPPKTRFPSRSRRQQWKLYR